MISFVSKMQIRFSILVAFAAVLLQHSSAGTLGAEAREDDETGRIIGGRPATEGQFPYVAALFYYGDFICTSSIIGPRTILTAAHCIILEGELQPVWSFHAIANYRSSANQVRIEFQSITPHPYYTDSDDGSINDIAILTTTEPINFNRIVRPICIARRGTFSMQYKNATAMGWGYTERGDNSESDELEYVEQYVVPNRICSLYYPPMPVENSKICAGKDNGICNGDSGGPLVHLSAYRRPVQIGVASYTSLRYGCGLGAPGVWTRVSFFNYFIVRNSADGESICRI